MGHRVGEVSDKSGSITGSRDDHASMHGPSPRLTWSSSICELTRSVAKTISRVPERLTTLTPAPEADR